MNLQFQCAMCFLVQLLMCTYVMRRSSKNVVILQHFVIFVLLRAVVGIGEACYSTIAPAIIADLFADNTRTAAISIFYMAIPVGRYVSFL